MAKLFVQLSTFCVLLTIINHDAAAEAYGSGWYGEVQASYGYEDNISRTAFNEPADNIASLSIGGGHSRKIGRSAELILNGYVTETRYQDFDELNNRAVSLGLEYTFQRTVNYAAPWYKLKASLTDFEYDRAYDEREGTLVSVDFAANRRITTNVTGRVGYRYNDYFFTDKSKAEEDRDEAFEGDGHEIYLGIDYQFRSSMWFYAEYAFRRGDVRSTYEGGPSHTVPQIPAHWEYDAESVDKIFDADCSRRCVVGYAARTRGDTHLITVGIAFPLRLINADVDLTSMYFDAEGANGEEYQDSMVKLGLIWNF